MKNKIILEVCIDSVQSAIHAEKGGASRVELCDNLFEGGTTPSAGTIEVTRKNINIGLHVIIRPRGGDFLYSDLEFEIMKKDVLLAKQLGANGVVFGMLNADGTIDKDRNAVLVELAYPMSTTFHRAFDMTADPYQALEDIISLGMDRVLTSGQERTVPEGAELIAQLVEKAGDRIIILPGGGIDEFNIEKIVEATGVKECHVSGRKKVPSNMQFVNRRVFMGGELRLPEYEIAVTDPERIRAMLY